MLQATMKSQSGVFCLFFAQNLLLLIHSLCPDATPLEINGRLIIDVSGLKGDASPRILEKRKVGLQRGLFKAKCQGKISRNEVFY